MMLLSFFFNSFFFNVSFWDGKRHKTRKEKGIRLSGFLSPCLGMKNADHLNNTPKNNNTRRLNQKNNTANDHLSNHDYHLTLNLSRLHGSAQH